MRVQQFGARGTLGSVGMIVVIQSLRNGDRPTGRLLREDIEAVAFPYGNNLQVHYKTAQNPGELEFLLRELAAYVTLTGRAPVLHIECHGDADGVQLTDGSYILWTRLKPLLVEINLASRMNMFLVLACCYGGYFAAECRYQEPVPFAYVVGPGKDIYPDPLFAFTGAFYTELLRTRDVTQALTVAGGGRDDISYFSMSAVGIFRIALAAHIRSHGSAEARAKLRIIEESRYERWRRQFFALEQFPENAERFAITYAEVFAQVEAERGGHTF